VTAAGLAVTLPPPAPAPVARPPCGTKGCHRPVSLRGRCGSCYKRRGKLRRALAWARRLEADPALYAQVCLAALRGREDVAPRSEWGPVQGATRDGGGIVRLPRVHRFSPRDAVAS
jgi:hypothetical protein